MSTTAQKIRYEQMAGTIRRARLLLCMNQGELSQALNLTRQSISNIEQMRGYPSRKVVDRFAELYQVNLDVYDWARNPTSAESLPGLLGLVPLHIVRLFERRLVDASIREGRARRLPRKTSSEKLPSIFA